MSNSLFSNSRIALYFAGVVLIVAMVASVALSAFAPASVADEEPAQEELAARDPAPEEQSSQTSGWADDGLTDDWGPSASGTAGDADGYDEKNAKELDRENRRAFGAYDPARDKTRLAAGSGREGEGKTYRVRSRLANKPVVPAGSGDVSPETPGVRTR